MIAIKDDKFIDAQKERLMHLQSKLEDIVTEMKQIQEFLNEYKV